MRAWKDADVEPLAAALADERVVRYLDHWSRGPYSMSRARQWVTSATPETVRVWAIECCDDGALIGSTGLDSIDLQNRRCSWGIWTGPPDRWGRGYGTEACMLSVEHAFRTLGLSKVSLSVWAGNDRARRAYEKAGFTSEGVLRRHYLLDGALVDVEVMAVFADNPLYVRRIAQVGAD
ncbi:MAG: GNAT family N-acetyltransferase [Candidatus Dormibacteraeota bacterium]|nr:GNAT family N-acetyltransferase [Candidatus Dormibacteraeota bacterium]